MTDPYSKINERLRDEHEASKNRSLSESRDAPCSVSEGQIVHMKCCINQFKVLSVSQYSLHLGCGHFSWIGTWDDFERDFKKPN